MERLGRDGWVSRQPGRGTFVGERVLLLNEAKGGGDTHSAADADALRAALAASPARWPTSG